MHNEADYGGDGHNRCEGDGAFPSLSSCQHIKNRKFPEKVIKYLWDDAFKFNREVIFETTEYQSLEQVIRAFMYAKGIERFKVFKDNVRDAFTDTDEE